MLLSEYAKAKSNEKVLDLGCGNGAIPLLLASRDKGRTIVGLEIQEKVAEMARRSVMLNGAEDKIQICCGDIKDAENLFQGESFDVITSNPPYMREEAGIHNTGDAKCIARHEMLCTFDDIAKAARRLLRVNGRFYLVHRPHRLADIFFGLRENGLEPKRMRLVHPYGDKEPNLVLLEAVKGGRPYLKVEPPLIIYSKPGEYTEEVRALYYD